MSDTEFAAEFGHGCVTVGYRGLGRLHLGFGQRELPAALDLPVCHARSGGRLWNDKKRVLV